MINRDWGEPVPADAPGCWEKGCKILLAVVSFSYILKLIRK